MRLLRVLLVAACCCAQVANSRLEGVVRDPSDLVVVGARITTLQQRTGWRLETLSGPEGFFQFPLLPPDSYTVTIEAPGFRSLTITNLALGAAQTVSQSFNLQLGQSPKP